MSIIINPNSPLSYLQQRLDYAYQHFKEPLDIAQNVPIWPDTEVFSTFFSQHNLPEFFQYYSGSQGVDLLIEKIKEVEIKKYNIKIGRDNILVSNGALHGLSLILQAPKQHSKILCQKPVFRNIPNLMKKSGYSIEYFELNNQFQKIEDLILLGEYDFIYLNIPNNPTGDICNIKVFNYLLKIAKDRNAKIILDMVYDVYIDDQDYLKNLLHDVSLKDVYIVNSLSKSYGSPGLRIGWVISDRENIQNLKYILELECICVSPSSQLLAVSLLEQGNNSLIKNVKESKKDIEAYFEGQDLVKLNNPYAGTCFLATFNTPNIEDFIDFMLIKYEVVLASSSNYDGLDTDAFRIPIGYPKEILYAAFEKILDGVEKWKEETG